MKNYDERIESIFRKYDEKIEAKRRKSALVRRSVFSVSGFCAAAIIGIFVWKMPYRTDIPDPDSVLTQESTTSVTVDVSAENATDPVTTSGGVDTTKNTASTTAKNAETTVRSTAITAMTSATTVDLMSSTTAEATSLKTTAQTSVSVQQSTETTIKDPLQTQTETITTNHTITTTTTTTIYQTTIALTTVEQTITTTNVVKTPDERIILAIENTDYSRSVSEFQNGEKYKDTGNYMKLTDISDFEYIDRFKVYYYFGPIQNEMSTIYKVYKVPNDEDKVAVQIDNSDFFLIFEKCIQK